MTQHQGPIPPAGQRPAGARWAYAFLIDIAVFLAVFGVIFGVYSIGRSWLGPVRVEAEISQDPRSLWAYALYSLVRILVAYGISLVLRWPTAMPRPSPSGRKWS
jgi:NitT/TauT family transport system permease protein